MMECHKDEKLCRGDGKASRADWCSVWCGLGEISREHFFGRRLTAVREGSLCGEVRHLLEDEERKIEAFFSYSKLYWKTAQQGRWLNWEDVEMKVETLMEDRDWTAEISDSRYIQCFPNTSKPEDLEVGVGTGFKVPGLWWLCCQNCWPVTYSLGGILIDIIRYWRWLRQSWRRQGFQGRVARSS